MKVETESVICHSNGVRSIRLIMDRKPYKCEENEKNLTNDWFGLTFDNTSEIYTDKNVVEHPSAKLIDCCRENKNSCSVVVDEGVPLKEKILEQTLKKKDNLEDFDFSSEISLILRRDLSNDINEVSEGKTDNYSLVKDFSYNSRIENGSIMFDSNLSPIPALDIHQNLASLCVENQNFRPQIDNISYKRLDLGQPQVPVDYPGIVACSSSLSFRSASSSTSNRSFAFPILQSEWHSSPIRMAKGDRRNLWWLRCWREGLFCCRF